MENKLTTSLTKRKMSLWSYSNWIPCQYFQQTIKEDCGDLQDLRETFVQQGYPDEQFSRALSVIRDDLLFRLADQKKSKESNSSTGFHIQSWKPKVQN